MAAKPSFHSLFALLLVAGLIGLSGLLAPAPAHANAKYASIVVDADTGKILRSRRADKSLHPASLTKMMTLYLAFEAIESGELSRKSSLKVSRHAAGQPPSKLGLRTGQRIRVEDVIHALVTKSANDAAVVLAEAIGGSESRFARMMTSKAREIGMSNTTFRNASGLYHRHQKSTARDMATLSRALIYRFPQYYHYFRTTSWSYKGTTYRNHNRLLDRYDGIDGLKTGYINAAGFNLAASAVRDGRRVIAVVFGGRTGNSRNRHMVKLLDIGFERLPELPPGQTLVSFTGIPVPGIKPRSFATITASAAAARKPATAGAAATTTAMVARGSALGISGATGDWSIQVGAFASQTGTRNQINRVVAQAPDLLGHAEARIVPLRTRTGRTIYRARLRGFDERGAAYACAALDAQGTDCLPLAPVRR